MVALKNSKISAMIIEKLQHLARDPYAKNNNIKKLQDIDGFRLRVGEYRILYEIYNNELKISVVEIDVRGSIYKN